MSSVFSLESKHKLFFLIFFTTIVAVMSALLSGEKTNAIYISLVALFSIWLTRKLWLPEGYGANKVRLYSLFVALSVVASGFYGSWSIELGNFITELVPSAWEFSGSLKGNATISSVPVYIFIVAVIWIVNHYMSNNSAMGEHKTLFDKDIPEPDFYERLDDAIEAFRDHIYSLDKQSNWSRGLFTPLEAEVFVKTKSSTKRKVTDLMKAMKSDEGRAFLILGDPGSGKSVALRKLTIELLNEVKKAQRIPIYINLKEWANTNWTEDSPPNVSELLDFVKKNIASRDIALAIFVENYFDRLYETKRFFFVFDSFDEIPQVMSVNHQNILIDQISDVLFKFLKDKNNKTVGLVASRKFRRPTHYFEASSEIEIRPLSDNKIQHTIKKMGANDTSLIDEIFSHRFDLYAVAKNPFMASMIAKFIKLHRKLPENQLEMFNVFIDDSLNYSVVKLDESSINKNEIIHCAKMIALKMFSEYGLEAPVKELKKDFPDLKIESALDCLKFARIIRSNSVDESRVSFVHRRFCEYFVVLDKLETGDELEFSDIPNDSQWRDALVLFCSVAPVSKASLIANKCWEVISNSGNEECFESIHCMRFLRDAFKGRAECVKDFKDELSEFVGKQIESNNSAYWVRLNVELSTLLELDDIESNVIKALNINEPWVSEAAVESCRNLPEISNGLEFKIGKYVNNLLYSQLLSNFSSLYFTFSISEAFCKIKKLLKVRLLDISLLSIVFVSLLFTYPVYTSCVVLFVLMMTGVASFSQIFMTSSSKKGKSNAKVLRYTNYYIKRYFRSKSKKGTSKDKGTVNYFRKRQFAFIEHIQFFLDFTKAIVAMAPVFLIWYLVVIYFTSDEFVLFQDRWEAIESPFVLTFAYLICLLSTLRLVFAVGFQKEKEKDNDKGRAVVILLGAFFVIPLIISALIKFEEYLVYLKYLFFVFMFVAYAVMFVLIIPWFMKRVTASFKAHRKFQRINLKDIDSRENISLIINEYKNFPFIIQKFMLHLEVNLSHVKGEWPDDSILRFSAGTYAPRLSKIDVRWRGLD